MKAYGFIHTHSEYSLKDAPLKLADIVKEAKKMGATAIALTDHGTAAGWIEFYDLCKNEGIKPILGVEAYIRSETNGRTHLILLAKNYTGYKEISQAISDSNENIERIADMDIPIMTKEILQKYLHGDNVIVTSACVSGVLSEILLSRKKIQEQVDSIKKKMDDYYSPYDTGYLKNKELVSSLDTEIAELTAKKEKLEIIAKRNFREQKKSLSIYKKEDLSLYEERKKQLEKEEQKTKEAKKSVSEIKKQIQNKKRSRTLINGRCKDAEKKQQKYIEAEAEICELTKKLTTEEGAIQKVKKEISWYTSFLGESFYIELQNHGLAEEAYVMPILASIAKEMKIPLVASNDVHILRKEDADIRQFIRSLRFKKYEEIGIADKELYMKDDKELSNALLKILPKDAVLKAMKGIKNICDSCNLVIPDTKHYPRYRDGNGNIVADSAALLRKKTLEGIPQRYPDGMDDERTKQMEYELNIIINMGYADYLLIVADYVNYAKEYSKKIGKGIGYLEALGEKIYEKKYREKPVLSEYERIVKEHDNPVHGYGIKELRLILEEMNCFTTICDENRKNPVQIEKNIIYVPDIFCTFTGKKGQARIYFEYECGNHTQTDFNSKLNRMVKVMRVLNFVTPNIDAAEKICEQVKNWIKNRGAGSLKKTKVRVTTIRQLKGVNVFKDENWRYVFIPEKSCEPTSQL